MPEGRRGEQRGEHTQLWYTIWHKYSRARKSACGRRRASLHHCIDGGGRHGGGLRSTLASAADGRGGITPVHLHLAHRRLRCQDLLHLLLGLGVLDLDPLGAAGRRGREEGGVCRPAGAGAVSGGELGPSGLLGRRELGG